MSSWGLGNIIFEITIFTWFFKFLVPKVDGYQGQKKLVNDFLKISKTFQFRLGTYNVPEGSSANPYGEARSAEFDGTGGLVTNIPMGSKIWCQVGGGGQNFQIYSR